MQMCQFQKERDEQAMCEFEFVISMNTRIVSCIFVSFAMSTGHIVEMKLCQFQKDRDEQARRKFKFVLSTFSVQFATRIVHHRILRGVRIGEASHLGVRLRRRGPRSLESRLARRTREGPTPEAQESQDGTFETSLTMLHINLRAYVSYIAEISCFIARDN